MSYKKQYDGKYITIKKERNHYLVCIGGIGYSLHKTKKRAIAKANDYRKQIGRKKR